MITPVFADFEARSLAPSLKKIGGRRYWDHPTSRAICCVLEYKGEWYDWVYGEPFPLPFEPEYVAAHNGLGFDRHAWRSLGWPEPKRWIDTSDCFRKAGLPGALSAAGKVDLATEKDLEGTVLTISLSRGSRATKTKTIAGVKKTIRPPEDLLDPLKEYHDAMAYQVLVAAEAEVWELPRVEGKRRWHAVSRVFGASATAATEESALKALASNVWDAVADSGRFEWPEIPEAILTRVVQYCGTDVEAMVDVWPEVGDWAEVETDVEDADRACADRGIMFDDELARALLRADAENAVAAVAAAGAEVASEIRSSDQFQDSLNKALAACGDTRRVHSAEREEVEPFEDHEDPTVASLVAARFALASIARGKLEAGLRGQSPDGALRDNTRYIGAHTWRWSGQRMQLHNMKRPTGKSAKWKDKHFDVVIPRVIAGLCRPTPEVINALIRPCLYARDGHIFAVADYSSVEARMNAFCAGDEQALEVFRSGKDVYLVAASTIYGEPITNKKDPRRQTGKIAELALGYQGGVGALTNMADGMGIDLSGIDPQAVVDAWRELHAPIVDFWHDLEDAAKEAAYGGCGQAGPFEFARVGSDVWMMMPSGRPIVYRNMRIAKETRVSKRGNDYEADTLRFDGARFTEHTYGGKLCENAIQGLCRELLAGALVRAHEAGLNPVLHVHDELVCEVPADRAKEGLAALEECMCELPKWAEGFPVGVEGFLARRYRK